MSDFRFFEDTTILLSMLEIVQKVSNCVFSLVTGEEVEYPSSNCIYKMEEVDWINLD